MEATAVKYEVQEILWPQKTFLTKRAIIRFDKLPDFFKKNYGELYEAVRKNGLQANEPPYAIYYSVDEVKKETDLAAAVRLQGEVKEIEGFERVTTPASKVLWLTYYGAYENMHLAYAELNKYIAKHGLKKEWMIEQYFSDPEVEKDPAKWKTDIYFLVK